MIGFFYRLWQRVEDAWLTYRLGPTRPVRPHKDALEAAIAERGKHHGDNVRVQWFDYGFQLGVLLTQGEHRRAWRIAHFGRSKEPVTEHEIKQVIEGAFSDLEEGLAIAA
jgi:hypothetical protein